MREFGHRHPARQYRRFAESAAAGGGLQQSPVGPMHARSSRRAETGGLAAAKSAYSAACARLLSALRLDLVDRRHHRIEGEQGRGVARLVVAHRLQHRDVGPFAGREAAPFSFSILRTVSRSARNSAGFAPITWRAMIEDEAWPSAQAFTSWAKSVTLSPSILRSTVTVEPHSLEWAVALASGAGRRPRRGILPASSRIRLL